MAERADLLERMRVASPCPVSWDSMEGDERVRFCRECSLHVYNVSGMTRAEAESLVSRTEGRLCARFHRRADGTVLTKDCPEGLRALRRRLARRAGAALAAVLALCGGAFGQQKSGGKDARTCEAGATSSKVRRALKKGQGTSLGGTVKDPFGAFIPGVRVQLVAEGGKKKYEAETTPEGKFEVAGLPAGTYDVEFLSPGFKPFKMVGLGVREDEAVQIDTTIELAAGVELMGIISVATPINDTPAGMTVFTSKEITRLPYE
jgi:hypothetical protein